MAQKDLGGKTLGSLNDVFADIFNVLVFQGREVIKEEDIEEAEPRSQYHAEGYYREQQRDIAKYWKSNGVILAFFGIENESKSTRYMPLRVIGYDGGVYRSQIPKTKKKKHRKKEKKRSLYPVLSLVLYFGTKRKWSTPKNLHGILNIPEGLQGLVNDYHVNVIDVAFLERSVIDSFKSDFWFVADYFWQIKNNKEYTPSKKEMNHACAVLQMMSAMTGDKRFEESYNDVINEGRSKNMCEFLDKLEAKGKAKGIETGIQVMVESYAEDGASEERIIDKLVRKYSLTAEEAKARVEKYMYHPGLGA